MPVDRPNQSFIEEMRALELAYLHATDEIGHSGFGGGRERWVEERSPLIEALDADGSFLDVGCANGLLAADVVSWAAVRGHAVEPFGIDLGHQLVEMAKQRMPGYAANFVVADAWDWEPRRSWDYVYSLVNLAPRDLVSQWFERLSRWVAPGGRLIIGAYGSRSRGRAPADPGSMLRLAGYTVAGESFGSDVTRFAWVDVARPSPTEH